MLDFLGTKLFSIARMTYTSVGTGDGVQLRQDLLVFELRGLIIATNILDFLYGLYRCLSGFPLAESVFQPLPK